MVITRKYYESSEKQKIKITLIEAPSLCDIKHFSKVSSFSGAILWPVISDGILMKLKNQEQK